MTFEQTYTLTSPFCTTCVWGERGPYNPKCAHCKYIKYSKLPESNYMTRGTAEALGLVIKKEEEE